MNPVIVREVSIGAGIPKICVPIVGVTREEILCQADQIANVPADMIEWRVDWFEDATDFGKVEAVLCTLREKLGEMPILFTFRTAKEGGEKELPVEDYVALNIMAAKSGYVDLVDVEVFTVQDTKTLVAVLHSQGINIVGSSHNFKETPSEECMVQILWQIQEAGADILKLAVMPKSQDDVMRLINATKKVVEVYAETPVVTMSMGKLGMVTRLIGEFTGSAITFGTAGKTSAPGQIPAEDVKHFLRLLHRDDNIEL